MSDRMRPMPFTKLLWRSIMEYKEKGTLFYVPFQKPDINIKRNLGGKAIESPIGPAAGPHTQLAQNILAAYAAGARYFELKTVQVLDGADLGIQKPCIYVDGEAYNTEWSSELTAYEALGEYIKAWYILKLLTKEFDLGSPDGFQFNMSVGYDLKGIKSKKIDDFINSMKDAKDTPAFNQCKKETLENLHLFQRVTEDYVNEIDSKVSDTITLSTMHGCPVSEIEDITTYLLKEKKLNTYLKCNPTLLGYDGVKDILAAMGYGYMVLKEDVFRHDITFEEVVTLIKRLKETGEESKVTFGIKLTNTLPVKIAAQELAGEDMYMSGPALYPITIGVAAKLSEALRGEIKISYSGGADESNIVSIYETGICPITVSTLLLKTGGYKNLTKLNLKIADANVVVKDDDNEKILINQVKELAQNAIKNQKYFKVIKNKKEIKNIEYTSFCSKCKQCVDVCPNRANFDYQKEGSKYTLHEDALCNECGNCTHFCMLGHIPYKEKFTIFRTEEDFYNSTNVGVLKEADAYLLRWEGQELRLKREEISNLPENLIHVLSSL